MKLFAGILAASAFLLAFSGAAVADTASNISASVDSAVNAWVPIIITLVFLGVGLGVLFAAVHKMDGLGR